MHLCPDMNPVPIARVCREPCTLPIGCILRLGSMGNQTVFNALRIMQIHYAGIILRLFDHRCNNLCKKIFTTKTNLAFDAGCQIAITRDGHLSMCKTKKKD